METDGMTRPFFHAYVYRSILGLRRPFPIQVDVQLVLYLFWDLPLHRAAYGIGHAACKAGDELDIRQYLLRGNDGWRIVPYRSWMDPAVGGARRAKDRLGTPLSAKGVESLE